MSSSDRPFLDSSIGYDKWAANLARTDEERARIDRAHLLEGTEILFEALRAISNMSGSVPVNNNEGMPDYIRKFIGAENYAFTPYHAIDSAFESAHLELVSKDKVSPDYNVFLEITQRAGDDPEVSLSKSYPVTKHFGLTPLQVVRVANWLVNYYREQTGQVSPADDGALDTQRLVRSQAYWSEPSE